MPDPEPKPLPKQKPLDLSMIDTGRSKESVGKKNINRSLTKNGISRESYVKQPSIEEKHEQTKKAIGNRIQLLRDPNLDSKTRSILVNAIQSTITRFTVHLNQEMVLEKSRGYKRQIKEEVVAAYKLAKRKGLEEEFLKHLQASLKERKRRDPNPSRI